MNVAIKEILNYDRIGHALRDQFNFFEENDKAFWKVIFGNH